MNPGRDQTRPPVPPLLAALALWGWQTGLLPWALGLGVLLEAARFSRARLEIRQADFNRLWNFTTLLFLAVVLYLFLARPSLGGVGAIVGTGSPAERIDGLRQISATAVTFLRWLPIVFYPFLAAFAWSRMTTLPWSTFSLYEQARASRAPEVEPPAWATRPVNPGYPYVVLVLFAACATTAHPVSFLPLLLGVIAWALWPWRNRRYRLAAWAGLLLLLLALSLVVQTGLATMREAWQSLESRLLQNASEGKFDQLRSFTALGAVGRLKQSGSIILRIHTGDGQAPGLLREAAFNRFHLNTWTSSHRDFQPAPAVVEGSVWRLAPARRGLAVTNAANGSSRGGPSASPRAGDQPTRLVTIARSTAGGEAPLALPGDTFSVRDLTAPIIETNYLAAARVKEGLPLAIYSVEHGVGGGFDGPPESDDTDLRHLGAVDREAIGEVAQVLGLPGQSPRDAIETVRRYFAAGFEYSLWQRTKLVGTNTSPLAAFLRTTHAGHCEYFATATALLLRAAGVPTRYAVGFSPEHVRDDDWLARGRDAHAWCLAHSEGRWVEIDNTPGVWREREAQQAGWLEGIRDWFSQAWYRFTVWRQQGGRWQLAVFVAGMVVISWLAWRQIRGSRWRRARLETADPENVLPPHGLDSEFFAIARQFEASHGPRQPHETFRVWLRRIGLEATPQAAPLHEALALHYRLRFDPRGLTAADRGRLRVLALDLTATGKNPARLDAK